MSEDKKPIKLSALQYGSKTGLACPKCGCRDFRTVKTWRIIGAVRRARVCRHCGWKGRSIEQIDA